MGQKRGDTTKAFLVAVSCVLISALCGCASKGFFEGVEHGYSGESARRYEVLEDTSTVDISGMKGPRIVVMIDTSETLYDSIIVSRDDVSYAMYDFSSTEESNPGQKTKPFKANPATYARIRQFAIQVLRNPPAVDADTKDNMVVAIVSSESDSALEGLESRDCYFFYRPRQNKVIDQIRKMAVDLLNRRRTSGAKVPTL